MRRMQIESTNYSLDWRHFLAAFLRNVHCALWTSATTGYCLQSTSQLCICIRQTSRLSTSPSSPSSINSITIHMYTITRCIVIRAIKSSMKLLASGTLRTYGFYQWKWIDAPTALCDLCIYSRSGVTSLKNFL